jgi:hypothetical protein
MPTKLSQNTKLSPKKKKMWEYIYTNGLESFEERGTKIYKPLREVLQRERNTRYNEDSYIQWNDKAEGKELFGGSSSRWTEYTRLDLKQSWTVPSLKLATSRV